MTDRDNAPMEARPKYLLTLQVLTMVGVGGQTLGPGDRTPKFVTYRSVEETVRIWREVNGCPAMPAITQLPDKVDDGTTVMQRTYGPGTDGAEVVLLVIKGGGHTWPGREPPSRLLFGKSTKDISANDLIWEFFKKHPMK